ncbi:MAG: DMT family transporter [bacterium]|nr:DMT family transporter [bacterium]
MNLSIPYLGETLAFITAIVWAFAVILFKKSSETVHPIALNLFKNTLAFILFIPTMLLFKESLFRAVPFNEYLLLIFSGFIGIGIGDTLFFASLSIIGAGLSSIVSCVYCPVIIAMSIIWLKETLSFLQVIGIILIIVAMLLTINWKEKLQITRKKLLLGISLGILADIAMAAGVVMIKPLLVRSPLLWATEIRLIGGLLGLIIILLILPSRYKIISSLFISKGWKYTIISSFLGAYIAMVTWLAGMKFTQVSIASALNQTSNIFIFLFAALLLKEPVTLQRIIAIILAVSGSLMAALG